MNAKLLILTAALASPSFAGGYAEPILCPERQVLICNDRDVCTCRETTRGTTERDRDERKRPWRDIKTPGVPKEKPRDKPKVGPEKEQPGTREPSRDDYASEEDYRDAHDDWKDGRNG